MKIKYVKRRGVPSIGDIRTNSDGSRYIRIFKRTNSGIPVVSNNRNLFDWADYNSDEAASTRARIESGKITHNTSSKSKKTGLSVHIKVV